MKKIALFLYGLVLFITSSCNNTIVIDDFESGTFNKWKIEGNAFGSFPAEGRYAGPKEIEGVLGRYLASSFHGGENSEGQLTSEEFKIKRDYINFLMGGGSQPGTYIELLVEGNSIYISYPPDESEGLEWFTWEVKEYKGRKATIRIVDNQTGPGGYILVDQIEMDNSQKGERIHEYELPFDIFRKYLLFPIEENAEETNLYIKAEGEVVSPVFKIKLAQRKVDYWISMDMEKYWGQNISLLLENVKKSDLGYRLIKQSDTPDMESN
ncbi:MAG: DUF4980 domain-containing protein [Candidatus Azobacteroides sp.]|nr:DUF4980 domain-containing protein [Candidatus Azobacteroides sp.]